MNFNLAIVSLQRSISLIPPLCSDIDERFAQWRPAVGQWSLLEVLGHLLDEEREDFRARIDLTLNSPGAIWPAIRPTEWVNERRYNEQATGDQLGAWIQERLDSIAYLRKHEFADWSRAARTPWGGEMRAGDLLAAWAAHDALHIRQMNALHYAWMAQMFAPYTVGYAGDW